MREERAVCTAWQGVQTRGNEAKGQEHGEDKRQGFGRGRGVKPYVERAMSDEKLRDEVMRAFGTARELYDELIGERTPITLASRVATDDDIRDKLREAIEDLAARATGSRASETHGGRNATLLVAGIALGILFNPVTGARDTQVDHRGCSAAETTSSARHVIEGGSSAGARRANRGRVARRRDDVARGGPARRLERRQRR